MQNRTLLFNVALCVVALVVTVGLQALLNPQGTTPAYAKTERCPEGGFKVEGTGPWECDSDGTITSVCIKAGTEVFSFAADGTDGCYTVEGIGTGHVEVTGGGTGRDCKEISHIVCYGGPPSSPEPSPTPESSPSIQ